MEIHLTKIFEEHKEFKLKRLVWFIEFENKIKIANNIAVFIDFYW